MIEPIGGLAASFVSFLVVLGVVVFVHEFGHYQVARWFKVKIESFSIGFGPELCAWTSKAGVRWRIAALPLGGYVKFEGDKDVSSQSVSSPTFKDGIADRNSGLFHAQPVHVRAAVTAAGPLFNFGFSIAVFAIFFAIFGEMVQRPIISHVLPDGAAAAAGMKAGDEVVAINGRKIDDFVDLQTAIMVSGGKEMALDIRRADGAVHIRVTPKIVERQTPFGDKETQGLLGIETRFTRETVEKRSYNPIQALVRGGEQTANIIATQFNFILAVLRGGMSAGHINGPLGIFQIAGKVTENSVAEAGPQASAAQVAESVGIGLVRLAAVLSVAVGFMNLLPLPVLDGGHLVFYAAEAVRGKPIPEKVQAISFQIGLACILSLFVFATFQDLERSGLFNLLKGFVAAG
ncbi:M50 family metallopeptidase [Candidatus Phycosocius spiralis]|nr:M50 family metallopeptidase [Candidatus Phycosocius spiralis]